MQFFKRLIICVTLLFSLICLSIITIKPVGAETVRTAPLGIFLTQLGDLDVQKKSFSATFWLWTQINKKEKSVLNSIEFPNAISVKVYDDIINPTSTGKWIQKKVVGTFRHNWDMRNFPFDYQKLTIIMEETDQDLSKLQYAPDKNNSSIDEDIKLNGWEIKRYIIAPSVKKYRSNFGDPNLSSGSPSEYTRMELKIELQRNDLNGFLKLSAGAFAASGLALVSYFLHLDSSATLGPRFSLLAGSMFAVVISLRSASNDLGSVEYLTLLDCIHLAVIFYILVAAGTDIYILYQIQKHNNVIAIKRVGIRAAILSTLGLFSLIGVIVLSAMHQR